MCSPGLSDGIFIPGCIFSDSIQADDADEEVIVVDDDYLFVGFDINYNSRSGNFVG